MKHFIGGFTLGVMVMMMFKMTWDDFVGWQDASASIIAMLITGCMFGVIAWGLLP